MKAARAVAVLMVLALVVVLVPSSSRGIIIANPPLEAILSPSKDAYTDSSNPNTNYGAAQILKVDSASNNPVTQIWMAFSLSTIPSNAQVISCTLSLFDFGPSSTSKEDVGGIDIFTISQVWTEGAITYNTRPTVTVGTVALGSYLNTSLYSFVPVYGLQSTCTNWLTGSLANNGLMVQLAQIITLSSRPFMNVTSKENGSPGANPSLTVFYQLPTATIYPAFYCASGPCETNVASGTGLPAYLFVVWYSENNGTLRRAIRPDILFTNTSTFFRLQVRDFWNNILYNQAQMVVNSQMAWNVSINYALLNTYNMRDAYTNLTVQPAGGTKMIVFLPPRGWWIFPLHVGTVYYLNYTLLNGNFGILSTINLVRTMPSYGLNYMVNGTSISEVRQVQDGQWITGNTTQGLVGAIGNIMLMPHGIDLFGRGLQLGIGGIIIPLTPWFILLGVAVASWIGWLYAYRGKLSGGVRRWPRRAKLWFGLYLFWITAFVAVALLVHLSGGQFIIPVPWVPL